MCVSGGPHTDVEPRFTELAAFITALLKDRDLSQSDIARALGVAPSRVVGWKAGTSRPRPENLEVLSEVYALDLDQLMRMCRYRTRGESSANPDETEMLAIYRQVPSAERQTIKRMLRGLARFASHTDEPQTDVTDEPGEFGRHMMDRVQPTVPRKKYQSQSLASMKSSFGFQPA